MKPPGHFRRTMQRMSRERQKLTDEQVAEMRARHTLGESFHAMSRRYGVTVSTIRDYCLHQDWRGFSR